MSAQVTQVVQPTRWSPSKIAMTVAVLTLLAVAGLGVRWWTHPSVFGDLGDSYTSEPRPVADAALSTTVIFPQVDGEPETVTIDRVHAEFSTNSAQATATFFICHLADDDDPIGAVHDPEKVCGDIEPFDRGASFRHGVAPDSDYLFVTMTPTTAGVAHLAHVEVQYRRDAGHLYQRGTETIRADRQVNAT